MRRIGIIGGHSLGCALLLALAGQDVEVHEATLEEIEATRRQAEAKIEPVQLSMVKREVPFFTPKPPRYNRPAHRATRNGWPGSLVLLLAWLLSSCAPVEYALTNAAQVAATEAAAPTALEPVLATLQPAPAGMSNGQARRFYAAQVAATKAANAQKVKNSNNTTVEQKISNVSPALFCVIIGLSLSLGAAGGGFAVYKLK